MARQIFIIFILLYLCENLVLCNNNDLNKKTLHIYQDNPTFLNGKRTWLINAPDEQEFVHNVKKRETKPEKPVSKENITVKANHLNDTHKQLMVHWVGEQTNIIICLAKDPKPHFPTIFQTQVGPSAVYISYDYGDTYVNKTDLFKTPNGTYAYVDKFYNHPKFNTHFVFTDTKNKLLFTTTNHGNTIKRISLDFEPSDVSFDSYHSNVFLVLDKSDPQKRLWLTEDFGVNWRVIQQYVASFFWYENSSDSEKLDLYIQRAEPSGFSTIIISNDFFKTNVHKVFAENVKDFQIKNDYIFVTKKSKTNDYDLFVSHKGSQLMHALFASELNKLEYHIADVTNNRIMVAVSHTDKLSNLYVSEGVGNEQTIQFSLSLENVFCYFPNSTWRDSWLHHFAEDAFADVYKVEGLTGIYIASQIIAKPTSNILPNHLMSLITYDHGGTWQPIMAPKFDSDGQPINCSNDYNCSLHLSQKFAQLYPDTRTPSIMTSKSAPGIILATGTIGTSLKGHYAVYVSTDAGITWKEAINDFCFFNMGDHGGILVAVKYYKTQGETRYIMYSTDEGEKWVDQEFHDEDLRLYGLMTEPGENTTVFTLFGSASKTHKWIIVKLDLKKAFSYNCKPEDYKLWSPSQIGEHRLVPCILGKQETYQRRIPHTNCYNGLDYDVPIKHEPCLCNSEDFECDYGFIKSENHCIRNKTTQFNPYSIPKDCRPGQFYNRTKGYRKIYDDVCYEGFSYLYLPDQITCPVKEIGEFLIVAQTERINRINLDTKELIEIPITGLKNVIAIDFDLKHNCLYWADIVSDVIGRQCLNGSTPEILVESNLASIEGIAYDWISNILYFVDGMRSKIEMIRTDIKHSGRMRKTIIGSDKLKKPRGIAVHPKSGYIFWTDWAPGDPLISRANMDGTNIKILFSKPNVVWPNGITIDHIAERIYFVDAKLDYIASSDLDGKKFKVVLKKDDRVMHPFAVAIFKDTMYWDDWMKNGIFSADKDHGISIQTIKDSLPGLMDLKVFAHSVQEGTNPCVNKSICEHICVGAPQGKYSCLCPDGLIQVNGNCMCPGNIKPHANLTCPQKEQTCSKDHFTCNNSLCVPRSWRCDGDDDCGDNSDEENCEPTTCTVNMHTCGDGKCIPLYWKCDYEYDCADRSDEKNCDAKNCTGSEFTCKNKRCIPNRWRCDSMNDCGDNSDEENCTQIEPRTCKPGEFKCPTGTESRCIPNRWRCDGDKDCEDGSDEANCTTNVCSELQFQCKTNKLCINRAWICDGDFDCVDHSDEENCTTPAVPSTTPKALDPATPCHEWMFKCQNKRCIPYWWKCDNVNDCGDGSDELGCGPSNRTTTEAPQKTTQPTVCPKNEFQCYSGMCIYQAWVCDGSHDCPTGEDELNCDHHTTCADDQFKCKIDGSCIALSAVCNNKTDCPDGSDEFCSNPTSTQTPGVVSCATGYFPCDGDRCFPEASFCDGKQDCYDGFDESNCNKSERVYQILHMSVDERGINSTSLLLYWWLPTPSNITFQYLPSISKITAGSKFMNFTWIEYPEFKFTNLEPYTEYNMTVYVRVKGSHRTFTPAKYVMARTGEGVPSPPINVKAEQRNGSHILLKWDPPKNCRGEIIDYEVCWAPPIPPFKQSIGGNHTYKYITSDFDPNIEYSFWVIAHNHAYESNSSQVAKLKFDADSNVDIINNLKAISITNNSVTLSWQAVSGADGYNITPEKREPYPVLATITTKTNVTTYKGLSPGVTYTFKVRAYKKNYYGKESILNVKTEGIKLPEVPDLNVTLVNTSGTSVNISWNPPKDDRKIKWEYGVYYALNMPDLFIQNPVQTTNLSIVIDKLEACEQYVFTVGIVGPYGKGPLSSNSKQVMTGLNPRAPPKHLKVSLESTDPPKMLVQWQSSCPASVLSVGSVAYIVSIYDTILNKTMEFKTNETSDSELSQSYQVNIGGTYKVKVSTYIENAIPSKEFIFRAPPILPPHQIQIISYENGTAAVFWNERDLPEKFTKEKKLKYVVLVNQGNQSDERTALKFETNGPPFVYNNVTPGEIYTFAVYLQTKEGYRSLLSEVNSIEVPQASWTKILPQGSVAGIVVPLILVLIVLASVLAFFVIKHRRLHQRFVRFVSSHYNTRSGVTNFNGDFLGEDDSPNIRGFSDDEPLVIA